MEDESEKKSSHKILKTCKNPGVDDTHSPENLAAEKHTEILNNSNIKINDTLNSDKTELNKDVTNSRMKTNVGNKNPPNGTINRNKKSNDNKLIDTNNIKDEINDNSENQGNELEYEQAVLINHFFNESPTRNKPKKVYKYYSKDERPWICDICQKSFTQKAHMLRHKLVHTDVKPYPCSLCEKTFSQLIQLNNHILTHSGVKPYACDVCNKVFSYSYNLSEHKKLHSGDMQFQCDVCQKTFSRSSYLISHKRTHTGEKPYACDICDKKFAYSHHLKNHKFIHSDERAYKCDICNKDFSRKENLRRHRKNHEGKIDLPKWNPNSTQWLKDNNPSTSAINHFVDSDGVMLAEDIKEEAQDNDYVEDSNANSDYVDFSQFVNVNITEEENNEDKTKQKENLKKVIEEDFSELNSDKFVDVSQFVKVDMREESSKINERVNVKKEINIELSNTDKDVIENISVDEKEAINLSASDWNDDGHEENDVKNEVKEGYHFNNPHLNSILNENVSSRR